MSQIVDRRAVLAGTTALGLALWLGFGRRSAADPAPVFRVTHTDEEWRKLLTAEQYNILRQAGTERPESSPLTHKTDAGRYDCAGCATPLFSSKTKFDSHTGWPSFWQPLPGAVITADDSSFGMSRTEVKCATCGGHLGHVFDDGPPPTGLRYCMNGAALVFHPEAA